MTLYTFSDAQRQTVSFHFLTIHGLAQDRPPYHRLVHESLGVTPPADGGVRENRRSVAVYLESFTSTELGYVLVTFAVTHQKPKEHYMYL